MRGLLGSAGGWDEEEEEEEGVEVDEGVVVDRPLGLVVLVEGLVGAAADVAERLFGIEDIAMDGGEVSTWFVGGRKKCHGIH